MITRITQSMQTLAGFHPLPTAYDRANKHLQVVVESVRLRLIEMEALLFSYVDYWQYAGMTMDCHNFIEIHRYSLWVLILHCHR